MEQDTTVATEGTAQSTSTETTPTTQTAPSDEVTQAREVFTKLSGNLKPAEIAEILGSNKDYVSEVTKTIRNADIERKARELATSSQSAELQTMRAQLEVLQRTATEQAAREEEAKRATMTDEEWQSYQVSKEVERLRTENQRLSSTVNQVRDAGAKEAYIENLASLGLNDPEDISALRKAANPEQFLLTAVDRAMAKVKSRGEAVDTLEARMAALERSLSGGSTVAATTKSSAGGDMSYADLQKAFVANPGDAEIKKQFYTAYRANRGK